MSSSGGIWVYALIAFFMSIGVQSTSEIDGANVNNGSIARLARAIDSCICWADTDNKVVEKRYYMDGVWVGCWKPSNSCWRYVSHSSRRYCYPRKNGNYLKCKTDKDCANSDFKKYECEWWQTRYHSWNACKNGDCSCPAGYEKRCLMLGLDPKTYGKGG